MSYDERLWIEYHKYYQKHHDGYFEDSDIPGCRAVIDELKKIGWVVEDDYIFWFLPYERKEQK